MLSELFLGDNSLMGLGIRGQRGGAEAFSMERGRGWGVGDAVLVVFCREGFSVLTLFNDCTVAGGERRLKRRRRDGGESGREKKTGGQQRKD